MSPCLLALPKKRFGIRHQDEKYPTGNVGIDYSLCPMKSLTGLKKENKND